MTSIPQPYLLFLGDVTEARFAKTAFGLREWAPSLCIGEYSLPAATISTGLPKVMPAEARARGAHALVIGVANRGGVIPSQWLPALLESLDAGLDLVSGMHSKLLDLPALAEAAHRLGRRLVDVRQAPANISVATGRKRSGMRLLTVGTDCALGKKYTALALAKAFSMSGLDAEFRATGQTGILIAGAGIPIDAVVADFVAGAAEQLSPDAPSAHWDVVEGQGSVFHPSYAGVSLGLLHGSQPDVLVVCHEVARDRILGLPDYATPSVEETIELNLTLARRTNPAVRCAGVSLNTSSLDCDAANAALSELSSRLRLPVADPIRGGAEFDQLVASCLASG
jgi:D-glutamate N-acetyltransferase